jgi:hypothetical protein
VGSPARLRGHAISELGMGVALRKDASYDYVRRSSMPLSNAEVQARWRKRNLIALTAEANEIVDRLVAMEDQEKLVLIVALLNARLNPHHGRCKFVKDDGGRSRSGIARGGKGDEAGDCVVRAIAIAAQKPYREVHDAITAASVRFVADAKEGWGKQARRRSGVSLSLLHADRGVHPDISGPYLKSLGWRYTTTKELRLHLRASELPPGRLIVHLPRHFCAVIDGVIRDTFDRSQEGRRRILGYWSR